MPGDNSQSVYYRFGACTFFKIVINKKLVTEARKLGRHRTKEAAVAAALTEYIQSRKRLGILALFGQIDYDSAYDYKRERRTR